MDDEDCRKLMKNLTTLKGRLGKQSHDFDLIIDILIEKGVFLFNKKDEIYAVKTESQKMDIFLKSLMASGPKAYGQFRDALLSFKDLRYEDVVCALDRTELTFVRGIILIFYSFREGYKSRQDCFINCEPSRSFLGENWSFPYSLVVTLGSSFLIVGR